MSESLDIERHDQLLAYLRESGRIAPDESPACTTLAGGVSNRTVLVERAGGEAWVLKQALAKLRVKVDWFSDPSRVHREALGLKWLEKLAPPGTITPLVFEDAEHHLLAMAAVPQPHENWKTMLLRGEVEPSHVKQFAEILSAIHRNSAAKGKPLPEVFEDRSFFESLRLEPYYAYTATQVPEALQFLESLIAETRAHRTTIVHGDFSPKNILVRGGRLVLLDHEVIHWGDPSFDLGFALTHFLTKAHHVPDRQSAFAAAAEMFIDTYAPDSDLDARAVRQTLGCLLARVAGRSQLEYLSDEEKRRQREITVVLLRRPPDSVVELVDAFV